MNIINDLRKLTSSKEYLTGRVVAMGRGMARVSTPHGVVEVTPGPNLFIGDDVTIKNQVAFKVSRGSSQTYQV